MMPRLLLEAPMTADGTEPWTTSEERSRAATFRNERRRREYLTWRALLRRELGCPGLRIDYDALGAPMLPDGEACISVSHCDGRVAVLIAPCRCAVDIEPAVRDFSRVADRYMTPSERELSADPLWPGYVWCAKEALYKYAGCSGLDFRDDLRIVAVDPAAGFIMGRIADGDPLTLSASCRDGFLVVTLL